jgi:hypothetical protein
MATQPRSPRSSVPAGGGGRARLPVKPVLAAYASVIAIAAVGLSLYDSLPAAGRDAAVWVTSAAFVAVPAGLVAAALLRGPFRLAAPANEPAGPRPPLLTRVLLALLFPAIAAWAVVATATVLPSSVDAAAYLAGVRVAVWPAFGAAVPGGTGAAVKHVLGWLPVVVLDMIIPVAVSFCRPGLLALTRRRRRRRADHRSPAR